MRTLVIAASVLCSFQVSAEHLALQPLQDPSAVCADGSPAGYYWRRSSTEEGSRLWIVYLEGGGWCYDADSCSRRCPAGSTAALCSSREWASELELGEYPCGLGSPNTLCGIFAPPKNSRLHDANKVYVRYCSSDAFMGNASAFGLEFRGAQIVASVVKDLVRRFALGLPREGMQDTLLFGGGSAGARGAMVHLDYVKRMLGEYAANGAVVKGFLDSPMWIDVRPFESNGKRRHLAKWSLPEQTQSFFKYANIEHLGKGCAEMHHGDAGWKCIFAQYRLTHVKTPFVLVASQYDEFQLSVYVGHRPKAQSEVEYAERLARKTAAVVWGLASPDRMIMSWACWSHMLSTQDRFSEDLCVGRMTMLEGLEQFLGFSDVSGDTNLIDTCEGLDCGQCRSASSPHIMHRRPSSTFTDSTTTRTATSLAPTRTSQTTYTPSLTTATTTITGTSVSRSITATSVTTSNSTTSSSSLTTVTTTAPTAMAVVADRAEEPRGGRSDETAFAPSELRFLRASTQPPSSPGTAGPGAPPPSPGDKLLPGRMAQWTTEQKSMLAVVLVCLLVFPLAWAIVCCLVPQSRQAATLYQASGHQHPQRNAYVALNRSVPARFQTQPTRLPFLTAPHCFSAEPRNMARYCPDEQGRIPARSRERGGRPDCSLAGDRPISFDEMVQGTNVAKMPVAGKPVHASDLSQLWSLFPERRGNASTAEHTYSRVE